MQFTEIGNTGGKKGKTEFCFGYIRQLEIWHWISEELGDTSLGIHDMLNVKAFGS